MSSIYPTQFNGKKKVKKIPYEKFKNLKDKDLIIIQEIILIEHFIIHSVMEK